MIYLSRREAWLICGIIALFAVGNLVRACRKPYLEFVPRRVETGARVLDAPEPAPAEDTGDID